MKTIFLHIGTEKTGTTTLQQTLAQNRDALAARGYTFPLAPGQANQFSLALYGTTRKLRIMGKRSMDSGEREKYRSALRQELAQAPDRHVVLSSEHLSSRLSAIEDLEQLKALLAPHAQRIKVIVYLRRQDDVMVSLYSTRVKGGIPEMPRVPEPGEYHWFDYSTMLGKWAQVFGRENVDVGVFEKGLWKNGRIEDDFFGRLGLNDISGLAAVAPLNTSLDVIHLDFLRRFNHHLPISEDLEGESVNPQRGRIGPLLSELSTGRSVTFGDAQMREFYSRYEESNRKVARDYLGQADGVLFRGPTSASRELYREITTDEAVQVAVELWLSEEAKINRLKQKVARLTEKLEKFKDA